MRARPAKTKGTGLTLALGLVEALEEVDALAHVAARVGGVVCDEGGAELECLRQRVVV